jgi:uncharacterized protein YecE (DUF72 family)
VEPSSRDAPDDHLDRSFVGVWSYVDRGRSIYERFGYLYSLKELKEWAPKLCELAGHTSTTHVLMNNCYRDYAQTNAGQLAGLLGNLPTCTVRPPPAAPVRHRD